jgi:hypothetical protein
MYLPTYVPQLDPALAIWSLAKRKLANSRPDNVYQLVEQVIDTLEDIRCSPAKLRGGFGQSELSFFALIIALFMQTLISTRFNTWGENSKGESV